MTALLVLPDWELPAQDFRRCLTSLKMNFPGEEVSLVSLPKWAGPHEKALKQKIGTYIRHKALSRYDRIIFIENSLNNEATLIESLSEKLVYRFDMEHPWGRARCFPLGKDISGDTYPLIDAHIFNSMSPHQTDMYYYFPYGYLFRSLGLGPINAFGFRIDKPLEIYVGRPNTHKLIAVFGGSSAWSLDCLYSEMFSYKLEEKLNKHSKDNGWEQTFSILNFGQHGHVLLNELFTYLLFCYELRPDIVIAHDGFNDFIYGMTSDRYLLDEAICYQFNHEQFAQKLHDSDATPLVQKDISRLRAINTPQAIIRAYNLRKHQFRNMVTGAGGKFIWGLQPYLGSKAEMSPEERRYITEYDVYNAQFGEPYRNMEFIYEQYSPPEILNGESVYMDFNEKLGVCGEDQFLFTDFCHLTPNGDDMIAEIYCEVIAGKIHSGEWSG